MKRKIFTLILCALCCAGASGQTSGFVPAEQVVTFRFVPGEDMFYTPWGGNDGELSRLYALIDEYRTEITSGKMPVYVDGYCTSLNSRADNLKTAAVRSNRVKSELITNKGLVEDNFTTKNHATTYTAPDGKTYRDMVVVSLRIPGGKVPQPGSHADDGQAEQEVILVEMPNIPAVEEEKPATETQPEPPVITECEPPLPVKPYCFAVRTNLLYNAFLLPTLGVEWRPTSDIGIKLDGSFSHWGNAKGKVQKIWLVNPEVRWYFGQVHRLYVGASGNFGEYNIYKNMIGSLFPDDTGYQGKLWGAGLTVGYQLYLSRSFSLDFNLGLGYTNLEYDSFTISNKTRVYKEKDKSKDFWGPTQAGVSLVWTIGK